MGQDPALQLRLLGEFELLHDDVSVTLNAARVQALVAYLALDRRRPLARQRIAFAFWPDSTENQAKTNLRNVLHHLRRALPDIDHYLDIGPRAISWGAEAPVRIDVEEFERAADGAAAMSGPTAVASLEAAVSHYRGDLLTGSQDEWVVPQRERLRERYAEVLERLLALHEGTGDHARTIAVAGHLLRHDPLREDGYRRLIEAHTAVGDRARALRAWHTCTAVLERELGVEPHERTRAAYSRTLGLKETPPSRGTTAAARALVGRDVPWTALIDAWRAGCAGQAQFVLVWGEAGVGKTRLIEELVQWVGQQRHPLAQTRSYSVEGSLAYAPVIDWLRSSAFLASLDRVEPAVRTELARLLPELAKRSAQPAPLSEAARRQRVFDAVARTIQAAGRPMTLIADDLQWSDPETLELVRYLVCRSAGPLLIVGTARREEIDAEHPLRGAATALAAAGRLIEIDLDRLGCAETAKLAERELERPLAAHEAERLYSETEGNPLFVIEALRAGWMDQGEREQASATPSTFAVSPKVQAVIEARLQQLGAPARALATLAATIGREFDLDLLARASGADEQAVLRGLDELWRRRIIRERGTNAYDFSHDKIREVAYLRESPLHRREMHLCVARALEALYGGDDEPPSGQLALHFDRGGLADRAVGWYVRAADAAHRASGLDAVARPLRRALELLQRLPAGRERDAREFEITLTLAAIVVALEGYAAGEIGELYARVRALCQRLGQPVPPPLLRGLALRSIATYQLDAAQAFGQELLTAGVTGGDDAVTVEGLYVLGVVAFWHGRLDASREHLEQAIARYRPERHHEHVALYAQDPKVVCLCRLSWTLWHLGMPQDAARARDDALAAAVSLAEPYSHAYALWFTLFAAIDAGDDVRVREHVGTMQRLVAEHRLLYIAAIVESFVGYCEVLDGQSERGVARMHAALADPRAVGQQFVLRPQTLLLLAYAHEIEGNTADALREASEGVSFAEQGARIWQGEFERLRGRLLLAQGADEVAIEGAFSRSLAVARDQRSAWIEMRAAADLARWRLRSGTAQQRQACRRTLKSALARFPGRADLPVLNEAARLLDELR